MKNHVLPIRGLLLTALLTGNLGADPAPQSQVSFTQGSGGTWNADWTGSEPNRVFFAQGSTDLVNWQWLPVLEFGTGPKGAGVATSGAPKYFFRLTYGDYDWVDSRSFAQVADFDGDGVPNWFEVDTLGSNPFDKDSAGGDSNGNGIADGYELFHFGALGVSGLGDDPDGDGLINQTEILLGMNADAGFEEGASDKWEIFLPE